MGKMNINRKNKLVVRHFGQSFQVDALAVKWFFTNEGFSRMSNRKPTLAKVGFLLL